jgi:hypothetical protein
MGRGERRTRLPSRLQRGVLHENIMDVGDAKLLWAGSNRCRSPTWVEVAIESPDLAHSFRGSSIGSMYSRPSGPTADTWVT